MGRRSFPLAFAAVVAFSATAWGQTQIKPRVLIMVDTSGSMTLHLEVDVNGNSLDSGGDGSFYYQDGVLSRGNLNGPAAQFSMDPGFATGVTAQCVQTGFDTNSRMASAKQAVTNVINGSGDIEWGLMRYSGTYCAINNTTVSDPATRPRMQPMAWPNGNYQAARRIQDVDPGDTCNSDSDCDNANGKQSTCDLTIHKCRCADSTHCPNAALCDLQTGVCECQVGTDCPAGNCDVSSGICRCSSNTHCTSGACNTATGQCVCNDNADCQSGLCDVPSGMCVCTADNQCSSETCSGGTCQCTNNTVGFNQCLSDLCDTNTGICGCTAGGQCPSGTCSGNQCRCNSNGQCVSGVCNTGTGFCTCSDDHDCMSNEFCVSNTCVLDNNLCHPFGYGSTSTRDTGNVCAGKYDLPTTYDGLCGTRLTAGNGACVTKQTCYQNSDCASNSCDLTQSGVQSGKWGYCTCGACAPGYTCSGGFCVYNLQCISTGGVVLVDPANTGGTSVDALKWVDGREIYTAGGNVNTDSKTNPELRARGNTPLAGAARSATEWYNGITTGNGGEDPQKACRPYVLVQLTDGFDTCEASGNPGTPNEFNLGPVAAAQSFVGATISNAKVPNKVYVIGLAFGGASTTVLDNIAKAGGTTKARLANTQQDIEAALADIVASSILVEKCNNADDDCNDKCDEPFPGVLVDGAPCTNKHSAAPCDNGLLGHCNAPGTFVCSVDQLSQVCQTRQCTTGTADLGKLGSTITLTVAAPTFTSADNGKIVTITSAGANKGNFTLTFVDATHVTYANTGGATQTGVSWNIYCVNPEDSFGCNGFDDNCDGLKDNCSSNPQQEGSCCLSACPACALLAGGRHNETCNNCDDDCDGTIDNNLTDVGFACGTDIGICKAGTQECCQNPTGACGGVGSSGTNTLRCIGGFPDPALSESCNGVDDNCDGQIDEGLTQLCFAPNTPGAANFPAPAMPNVGPCRNGTRACAATSCGTAPNGCCPGGWPNGKPCPGPATFSNVCVNAIGPGNEICNGIDDDCDGTPDDSVTDSWIDMACCRAPSNNLADCPNMNGCGPGMYKCMGGMQQCVGGKFKTAEVCNGADDNCNGVVDDSIPGNGGPCGNNVGRCRAHYVCTGSDGGGPNGLTCMVEQDVMPELCDGFDNDCDGETDELTDTGDMHDLTRDDPRVGAACDVPAPPANLDPCKAGTNKCEGGSVVCTGSVKPIPNECGKPATDCTGNPANTCPEGAICFMGNCVTECANTEFPCPGGFRCDRTQTPNLCLPDKCLDLQCMTGLDCRIRSDGTAFCQDPCEGKTCSTGQRCRGGACVDDSCRTFGCDDGEVCRGTPPTCQADPCATKTCGVDQFCANGECKDLCATLCLTGQACIDGVCIDDPCADKTCTAGQVCKPVGDLPTCVQNACFNSECGTERVCCGGACVDDPCLGVQCPSPTICVRTSACAATCTAIGTQNPEERIVGAGGGGVACSMGGRGSPAADFAFFGFFVFFAFFLRRRRGSEEVR